MKTSRVGRREFVRGIAGSAAAIAALPAPGVGTPIPRQTAPKIKFGVIGLNHGHIYGQVSAVQRGGGELVSMYAKEPELVAEFVKRHPNVKVARSEAEVLEDKSLQLVASASIPDERGPLGVRVMKHGKDYLADKPGITTLEQLADVRRVQAETKRIYSIMYSERLENRPRSRQANWCRRGRSAGSCRRSAWDRTGPTSRRGRPGSSSASVTAASCATSARIRPINSSTSPARRAPTWWPRKWGTSITRSTRASRISAT